MNQSKRCPVCHKDNIVEADVCAHCGQTLRARILDSEQKEKSKIVCPICHSENDRHVEVFSSCGQRLRSKQLNGRKYGNYFKKHSSKTNSQNLWTRSIFLFLS